MKKLLGMLIFCTLAYAAAPSPTPKFEYPEKFWGYFDPIILAPTFSGYEAQEHSIAFALAHHGYLDQNISEETVKNKMVEIRAELARRWWAQRSRPTKTVSLPHPERLKPNK